MTNSKTLTRLAALSVVLTLLTASNTFAQTPASTSFADATNQATLGTKPAPTRLFEAHRMDVEPVATVTNTPRPATLLHAMEKTVASQARVAPATQKPAPSQQSWFSRNKMGWTIAVVVFVALGIFVATHIPTD